LDEHGLARTDTDVSFWFPPFQPIRQGDKGEHARTLQQLCVLSGYGLDLDGVAGPATFRTLDRIRSCYGLPAGAREVGQDDWMYLCRRLYYAAGEVPTRLIQPTVGTSALRDLVCWLALRIADQKPRELLSNLGPWVSFFAHSEQGIAWCAAFVTQLVTTAWSQLPTWSGCPIRYGTYCPTLAKAAQDAGRYTEDPARARRGDLILFHPAEGSYKHIGICLSKPDCGAMTVETIEGNTNEEGSYEGTVVARKIRGLNGKAYILLCR